MKHDFLKILAFSGLSLVFFVLALSVLMFFINIPVSSLNFIIANIISFVFISIIFKNFKKTLLAHILNFIIIFALVIFYFPTKDFSSDVLLYHLPTIKLIQDGWNPVILASSDLPNHLWAKYFAKGPWIIDAVIGKFFNMLEISRLINAFMIYLSAIFSFLALKSFIKNKYTPLILALIAGFNTISMVQMFTFLVDGFLSSALTIFISSIFLYAKTNNKIFLLSLAFSACLSINSKLSAFAYIFIIGLFSIYFFKKDFKYLTTLILSGLISLFVIGFNPFSINLIKHFNPFYPIGSNEIKIVEGFSPKDIQDKFYLSKFVISQFAVSNSDMNKKVKIKIPFSITKEDIMATGSPQTNLSGFGLMFSGVILLSILFALFSRKKQYFKELLIIESILFTSVFINPECWWARFIPQFYLFPVILTGFLLMEDENKKYKFFGIILTAAMLLNTVITGYFHFKKLSEYQQIQNELTFILTRYNGDIYVNSNDGKIEGIRIKLNDYNIKFKEQNGFECAGEKLKYSTINLCLIK